MSPRARITTLNLGSQSIELAEFALHRALNRSPGPKRAQEMRIAAF
jgi:hypothetical protein